MGKDTIIKFLNDRCTKAELEEIVRWAGKEAFSKESIAWGSDDWNTYQGEDYLGDDEKFIILFDKIQGKINTDIPQEKPGSKSLSLFATWLVRAAAILLIPVLSFLFYTLSELRTESAKYARLAVDSLEIIAPINARAVVQLPDGSEAHLNYGSKIKYPQIFSGDTREIRLTGEGYFDVAHNPEKPFIVKTGGLNIKALGTVFNVLAYPDNDIVEVTLINGKVILEQNRTNKKAQNLGYMVPGQHVNYNVKTGVSSSTKGNIEKYIAWKDGRLLFEDATIFQVIEKLTRMFNVDIELTGDLSDCMYTVTFNNESLSQILDLMTLATPVRYRMLAREKLPDGTYSKQKILIERRR
ncbi:MAG: hypothetical protein A2W90_13295 [Bacteroidetes bacterium GWF2_42_66]|nr:MAG: hypothetical protein A2W92_19195 [Bacteroidetes bacterium GWA2_42_15]OFY00191.1 MAG: hypothetical protein A2W89_18285 [Bacteroidetes bacterium GWE2_42_39]OFY40332.1 MAG: hypothetical protein A2W90_13295 [Bacteroidetes bacterium GWF2_42_66]HBL73681.1 hypothetical protein [Prolixibacteraceae bacterium]HCR90691.1 hypothetical protein [Prolixibacteraceae bacterium]